MPFLAFALRGGGPALIPDNAILAKVVQRRECGKIEALLPAARAHIPGMPRMSFIRTVALIGMMGAGKTKVGRLLAQRQGLKFIDADTEIQEAAGCSIEDIFEMQGEAVFREGERKVIARLLNGPVHVLATGGGAFQNASTRAVIAQRAVSVWLKADLDVLWERVSRRANRPMLKTADPRRTLADLIEKRYPVYALADLTVVSEGGPVEETVQRVEDALSGAGYFAGKGAEAGE
ncbi:MAG: shikimate kinase [Rhodospirillales bacterium]|nr:shikimate kinase [Rhodospirillales bacterium]